jgi:hypothetical protein
LLVFFFKVRSESNRAKRPGCAHCDCHRSPGQPIQITGLPEIQKTLDPDR